MFLLVNYEYFVAFCHLHDMSDISSINNNFCRVLVYCWAYWTTLRRGGRCWETCQPLSPALTSSSPSWPSGSRTRPSREGRETGCLKQHRIIFWPAWFVLKVIQCLIHCCAYLSCAILSWYTTKRRATLIVWHKDWRQWHGDQLYVFIRLYVIRIGPMRILYIF